MGSIPNPSPEAGGPAPSAIDLCSVDDVCSWLSIKNPASPDVNIQGCITAFSAYVLRHLNRANADGSTPDSSSLLEPVMMNEWYDGNGADRMFLRITPIQSVSALSIDGKTIPLSTDPSQPGFVIDQARKMIVLRGGGARWPYGFMGRTSRFNPGGYRFSEGVQNINVQYLGGFNDLPQDLWQAAVQAVALNYKRRAWVGQRSQAYPEAGQTTYTTWEFDPFTTDVLEAYKPRYY